VNPETKTDTFLFSEQAQYGFATCCEEWLCLSVEFIPYLDCASTADEYLRLLVRNCSARHFEHKVGAQE